MYHTDSIYWLGSLFQKGLTTKDYNDVIEKIKEKKIDYLLFDDPNDLYIQPRQPENAFNNRIISSLNNEYCAPRLTNGWLIAERKLKNNCKL